MANSSPQVSIVIPTHNRLHLMREMLRALEEQEPGTPDFEVIVVADGCTDGTPAMLRNYDGELALRIVQLGGAGPAIARNAGADRARGELLLFLDDDVLPVAGLVSAHAAAHDANPGGVVIGPYPPLPDASSDLFRLRMQNWWMRHFKALEQPGHRFTFRDLLTGNLSISHLLWRQVGGLDPQFARAREDLELGVRLLDRGVRFYYAPNALGWHHEHKTSSLPGAFRRAREEGLSDARMVLKHPHLAPALTAVRRSTVHRGRLRRFILEDRRAGFLEAMLPLGANVLRMLDALGFWRSYERLYTHLYRYAYKRGATDALGGKWTTPDGLTSAPAPTPLAVDLATGLEAAATRLSAVRPTAVQILYEGREIGNLPHLPAAELWDGRHLRQALLEHIPLRTLASVFVMPDSAADARPGWQMLGEQHLPNLLSEAQRQWARAGL